MEKETVSREETQRVYARCKYRGQHMLDLHGDDLKKFISECMTEELKQGKQRPLKKDERLKRAKKLVTKYKRREKKPKEHKFVYVNVTPSEPNPILQDFFVDPIPESKKAKLNKFMDSHSYGVDYDMLIKKLKEIENDE